MKPNELKQQMLNNIDIKNIIYYNPENGVFTWLTGRMKGKNAGAINSKGYLQIAINHKIYQAHRLAWFYVYGIFPYGDIDHINRVKTDNRLSNIREVTRSKNLFNRALFKSNKSGEKGVCFLKKTNRWLASARLNGKEKYLGVFVNFVDAVEARNNFINNFN